MRSWIVVGTIKSPPSCPQKGYRPSLVQDIKHRSEPRLILQHRSIGRPACMTHVRKISVTASVAWMAPRLRPCLTVQLGTHGLDRLDDGLASRPDFPLSFPPQPPKKKQIDRPKSFNVFIAEVIHVGAVWSTSTLVLFQADDATIVVHYQVRRCNAE